MSAVLSPNFLRLHDSEVSPLERRGLWSLWDMAGTFAWQFFVLSEFVTNFKAALRAHERRSIQTSVPSEGLGGLGYIFEAEQDNRWLNEEEQKTGKSTLSLLKEACEVIGINNIGPEIGRITNLLEFEKKDALLIHLTHLTERIIDELSSRSFVHIPNEKIKFYKQEEMFGSDVGKKFPKLIEDISSAGTCYALGQNTACVFHLMRIMEHCVQRFGKKLKVSIDTKTESWHQIMLHVHSQIEQLPGGKNVSVAKNNRKSNLASAAARLDHVRIAWRNDVMHPKGTYDEEEALEVLTSVGAFLKSVAPLL